MPLERFLQSPEAQSFISSAGNTNISFPLCTLYIAKSQRLHKGKKILFWLRWCWRSKRVRRWCQLGRLPMVPRYTVACTCSSVGACRRGQKSRSLCDSSKRDPAWGICADLQLSGQSQGEAVVVGSGYNVETAKNYPSWLVVISKTTNVLISKVENQELNSLRLILWTLWDDEAAYILVMML